MKEDQNFDPLSGMITVTKLSLLVHALLSNWGFVINYILKRGE